MEITHYFMATVKCINNDNQSFLDYPVFHYEHVAYELIIKTDVYLMTLTRSPKGFLFVEKMALIVSNINNIL